MLFGKDFKPEEQVWNRSLNQWSKHLPKSIAKKFSKLSDTHKVLASMAWSLVGIKISYDPNQSLHKLYTEKRPYVREMWMRYFWYEYLDLSRQSSLIRQIRICHDEFSEDFADLLLEQAIPDPNKVIDSYSLYADDLNPLRFYINEMVADKDRVCHFLFGCGSYNVFGSMCVASTDQFMWAVELSKGNADHVLEILRLDPIVKYPFLCKALKGYLRVLSFETQIKLLQDLSYTATSRSEPHPRDNDIAYIHTSDLDSLDDVICKCGYFLPRLEVNSWEDLYRQASNYEIN